MLVEYDVFVRLKEYFNGFKVIISPPSNSGSKKNVIGLKDSNIIELVDENWLKIEKKRLHRIYKKYVYFLIAYIYL